MKAWLIAIPIAAAIAAQQAPPRATPVAAAGTALVAGMVVNDAGSPVRLAVVSMSHDETGRVTSAFTDDQGHFQIAALAAGRYTLSASKVAHVANAYGAKRPGRRGTPLQIADGQQLKNLSLTLPRGAVVTGVVRDAKGQPIPGAEVAALPAALTTISSDFIFRPDSSVTDDRGVYRIFGLPPGEYVVAANSKIAGSGPMAALSAEQIDAALRELQAPGPRAIRTERDPQIGIAMSYYPGTASPQQAQRLTLAPGDERSGLDIVVQMVRTGSVSGTLVTTDGSPLPRGLSMTISGDGARVGSSPIGVGSGGLSANGTFRFSALQPGTYRISAGIASGRGAEGAPGGWARATVSIDGNDITNLVMTLRPALAIKGRVQFDSGARASPPAPDRLRVSMTPVNFMPAAMPSSGSFMILGSATTMLRAGQFDDTGAFTVSGVLPGRYNIYVSAPSSEWQLGSAMLDGRDIADVGIEVGDTDINGVVVTMIDTHTELSGTLSSSSGQAAPDYFVVAFPADKTMWVQGRRMQSTRPGSDGRFLFRDLPAGDYLMAALTDLEPSDLADTSFVEQLAAQAIKVTVRAAGKTVQDIKIR